MPTSVRAAHSTTGTVAGSTTAAPQRASISGTEPTKVSRHTILVIWLAISILAAGLLIAGLASPRLVSGTVIVNDNNATEFEARLLFSNNDIVWWRAGASMFMLAEIALVVTIGILLFSMQRLGLVPYAQTIISVANVCGVVGFVCVGAGFAYLDDTCEGTRNNCEFPCTANGEMSFFQLCNPYEVDTGLLLLMVAVFLSLVGALTAMCLRIPLYREPALVKRNSPVSFLTANTRAN